MSVQKATPITSLNNVLIRMVVIYNEVLRKALDEPTSLEYKIYVREKLMEVQLMLDDLKEKLGDVPVIH